MAGTSYHDLMTDEEDLEPAGRWDGWLGPRTWIPAAAILGAIIVALGVVAALALRDDGGSESADGGAHSSRPPLHDHADFLLFIRGQKWDFNQEKYFSDTPGKELSPNVHLHAPRFNVVHVHTSLTTWDEFLRSLGFTLDDPSFQGVTEDRTCLSTPDGQKLCNTATEKWKFIANGVQVDGISNVYIGDLTRVLISYGTEPVETVLKEQWAQITDEACIPSGACPQRAEADYEPCSGAGQCTR